MLSFQISQIKVSLVARITVKEGQRRYGKGRRGEIGERGTIGEREEIERWRERQRERDRDRAGVLLYV